MKYPTTQGEDIAGEVVEVGTSITIFRVGDRVLALAFSNAQASNKSSEGGFQHYTFVREHLTTRIPSTMSYEQACAIPLGLSTAAYHLFHTDFLALD